MGWLRKFLGIEPNDHPGLNDGFPPGNNHRGMLFMDDDDDLPSHSTMFDIPSHWSGSPPNITVIDPFQELENMMQDLFLGSGTIFNGPNPQHHHSIDAPPSCPTNPRDQLLKQPDSEITPHSDDNNSRSLPPSEHFEGSQHHNSLQPFNPGVPEMHSLFSLFDHFIGSLGRMESFSGSRTQDGGNFSDHDPAPSPRDAMIKKDTDLDEQTESSGLGSLLTKEAPSYSYSGDGSPRGGALRRPEEEGSGDQWLSPFSGGDPHIQRSFTSTSIRRIVRPDGSIEERRTYRDSTGKEEVTVTEMDPATAGSLLTKDDFYGNNGGGSLIGSIFRSLF